MCSRLEIEVDFDAEVNSIVVGRLIDGPAERLKQARLCRSREASMKCSGNLLTTIDLGTEQDSIMPKGLPGFSWSRAYSWAASDQTDPTDSRGNALRTGRL